MTRKRKNISSVRLGRPALKPGRPKRSSFNTRLRTDTKEALEAEAKISGRSLSEEIEFRLEQTLRDKDALIEAFGGRDTYDVLRLFGSVAAVIKTQTGKTATDWKTGLAISHAWKQLILDWVPRPPAEWVAELNTLRDDVPDRPVMPEEPVPGGLLGPQTSEEDWEAFQGRLRHFNKDWSEYKKHFEQYDAAVEEKAAEIREASVAGQGALRLLSAQEN
jgi:hypothetical protein